MTIEKENKPHFESVDCAPAFFHKITSVSCTHNAIDSITINNQDVNYDTSKKHFSYISSIAISLMLLLASTANAQEKNVEKKDSVPLLRGFAVSVDLVGPAQMFLGDYGQYEAALRINLRDKYFPVFELGLGKADHDNDVTKISYKTSAPYAKSVSTSIC